MSPGRADAVAQLGVGAVIVAGAVEAGRVRVQRLVGFWRLLCWALWLLVGAYLFGALGDLAVPGPWDVAGLVVLLAAYPFLFGALTRRAIREQGFEDGVATLMDVAILVASLTVASIPLLVVPLAAEHSSLSLASGITWASDVGLLGGGLWLLYRLPRGADLRSIALLAASLAVFSVLTLVEATLQIHSGPAVPWWLHLLFGPPYVLVALAPRFEQAEAQGKPAERALGHWLSGRVTLPYLAFVPLLAVWFVSIARGWDTRLFGSGIAVVASLVIARQLLLLRDNHRMLVERARQALTDELTGVRNRRAFDEDLALLLDIARRRAAPLVVLMVDLDDLKTINDTEGHFAGDRALVTVAAALSASARTSDRVYRLGGDEFAMLFPDAGPGGAERVLADARERMAELDAEVSVSAGIAAFPADGRDPETLLMLADRRLYGAKRVRPGGGHVVEAVDLLAAGEALG
jgi:diguanylate cyclase (GGDEF)-like protein